MAGSPQKTISPHLAHFSFKTALQAEQMVCMTVLGPQLLRLGKNMRRGSSQLRRDRRGSALSSPHHAQRLTAISVQLSAKVNL
jgi:hypothetical protein